tara:strand:- start:221 stop:445 length:225 start_codon:yes stop_codon:yes gene_type:complete
MFNLLHIKRARRRRVCGGYNARGCLEALIESLPGRASILRNHGLEALPSVIVGLAVYVYASSPKLQLPVLKRDW